MKAKIVIAATVSVLTACGSVSLEAPARSERTATTADGASATTLEAYKQVLARRISQANAAKVYGGRPQALLRSVIVVKYSIDGSGNLLNSEIVRSNDDHANETTALAALRNAAPFPKPASHWVHRGRVELTETWLFNNDGRFQLRTIAQPQMDQ